MAVASGSRGLAAVVVLGEAPELALPDRAVLDEWAGPGVVVHLGDASGALHAT